MNVTMTERFRIPAHVHARRFDDDLVVVDLDAGKYFSLDVIGSIIWDQLTAGSTGGETVIALLGAFDVDEPTARADVQRLVEELIAAGLLLQEER